MRNKAEEIERIANGYQLDIARIAASIQLDIAKIHRKALTALEATAEIEITFANGQHIEKIIRQLNEILLATIPYTP